MTRKTLALLSLLIVVIMLGLAVAIGRSLPPEARLPIHWGLSGEADGFAGKWVGLLLPAGLVGAVSLLFYALPALEPRRQGLERSQGLYLWGWAAVLLMGAALELAFVSVALGWALPVARLIVGATGLMFLLIGNQLGKSRSMYLIGLRTPWTLASEEVWIKTHRLAGKLMVAAGAIVLAAALLAIAPGLRIIVLLAVVAIAAIVPIVYSYLLWQRERREAQPRG